MNDRFKWPLIVGVVLLLVLIGYSLGNLTESDPEKPAGISAPSFSSDADATDAAFVQTVQEEIPYLATAPDDALITAGQDVCSLLESYHPLTTGELMNSVMGFTEGMDGNLTLTETSFFFGAATSSYCPAVYAEIEDLGNLYGA